MSYVANISKPSSHPQAAPPCQPWLPSLITKAGNIRDVLGQTAQEFDSALDRLSGPVPPNEATTAGPLGDSELDQLHRLLSSIEAISTFLRTSLDRLNSAV